MFLSCGDSLFDMFVGAVAPSSDAGADNTRVSIEGVVGGSPMNVALGLSRFEHHSRYFTNLSSDLFGKRIAQFLDNNGVDRSLSLGTNLNTSLAMVETGDDGAANYVFYLNESADVSLRVDDLPAALPDDIRVLHFGSYSTAVEPVVSALKALAARETTHRLISYDPNLRLSIEPDESVWRSSFNAFAATANLIKASDEDIAALYGKGKEDNFVADCFSHGAELVYITRGPDGASAFDSDGSQVVAEGIKVDVVDTVGAGDTFQAAVLHWLADNKHVGTGASIEGRVDLAASLAFAIKAAAVTCTRRGADLPRLADIT